MRATEWHWSHVHVGQMRNEWVGIVLVVTIVATVCAGSSPAPPQFNTTSYARCVAGDRAKINLAQEVNVDHLDGHDLLLVWLSVYGGKRFPGVVNTTLQEPAFERWSVPFWEAEEVFAEALYAAAKGREAYSMTPGETFGMAVDACQTALERENDAFCASLVSQNVFRLLGRYKENVDQHGVDYSPVWFVANKTLWVQERIPAIHQSLIILRRDSVTEKWGTWYHVHGLMAFGIQEMILFGVQTGSDVEDVVVALNKILNPILAGGEEDPVKAKEDQESVALTAAIVSAALSKDPLPPYNPSVCGGKGGYILSPWAPNPSLV